MSEVNVFGSTIWSSSGFDTGIDSHQYAIFQLKPEFKNSYGTIQFTYLLKDVITSSDFAIAWENGAPSGSSASESRGVRPRFLID